MSLQEEIKKINEKIEVLNKDMQSLMSELDAGVESDFPQDGEEYWYIDDDAEVMNIEWYDSEYSRGRVSIGNIFRNEKQAEFAVEKLKVEAELRKFSRPFEYGENCTEFYYEHEFGRIMFLTLTASQTQGAIYFESKEKAQQAIESVGEDRIKKYIFGVEG